MIDRCPVSLSSPEFHTSPKGHYAELRRKFGSVIDVELVGGIPAWLIVGYRELHQITSDPELFPRDSSIWNQRANIPPDWPLAPLIGQPIPSIYFTVGAEHRRHVSLVEPALEAVDLFELKRLCEELADRRIDSFCGRGHADLIADYAVPLPVLALAQIVGFSAEEAPELAQLLHMSSGGGPNAQAANERFAMHMARLVAVKRAQPGSDVASRMVAHGAEFTDEEYANDLMTVTGAGHVPTSDWIGNSMRLMLTDDRFAAALGGGRHSIGQAMNEVLWEDTPAQILAGRWAARDTRLGGVNFRTGDLLLLGLAAANDDPLIRANLNGGAEPAHMGNSAHFSFSYGEYRCPFPAREIAEVIARTAIEVLLDRLPDIDLAVHPDELDRRPTPFFRGMTALPARFTPVRAVGGVR